MTRDYITDRMVLADEAGNPVLDVHGKPLLTVFNTSFASENWNKAIRDRTHPSMFVRRHLEACVLTYLGEELRTGVAVDGAQAYASWADQRRAVLGGRCCVARACISRTWRNGAEPGTGEHWRRHRNAQLSRRPGKRLRYRQPSGDCSQRTRGWNRN